MTETPRADAPARRAAAAATGTTTARSTRAAGRPAAAATEGTTAEAAGTPPARRAGPLGFTIRVPFLTITLGPQPLPPAAPVVEQAGYGGGTLERLAFYGGVVTMGALGVLDWPVAAAIAAGTWVAQHTLPGRPGSAVPVGRTGDGGNGGNGGKAANAGNAGNAGSPGT
jgi:hypothetical protein